jgi:hypothetical protein
MNPPQDPPCGECRIELFEENAEAGEVFMLSRGQVVTIGPNVVDISIPAVLDVMDLLGVGDRRRCLIRVVETFRRINRDVE